MEFIIFFIIGYGAMSRYWKNEEKKAKATPIWTCPECRESMSPQASICPHCRSKTTAFNANLEMS